MKVRVLVSLEEIDNGWLNPARKASTCAVAQALVNAQFVRATAGVEVLNNTVLLRLPNDADKSVFTVSVAFSEWISDFDRWTSIRSNYQKWRKECAELRRLGRTDLPPMPTVKGKAVAPVTVILDTEERHVSIEGEPKTKSERVVLPPSYRDRYILSIRDNFESLLELDSERINSLCRYLRVVAGGQLASSARRMGPPAKSKAHGEIVVNPVSNYSGNSGDVQAHSPEKYSMSTQRDKMSKNQNGSKCPKSPSVYPSEYQTPTRSKIVNVTAKRSHPR